MFASVFDLNGWAVFTAVVVLGFGVGSELKKLKQTIADLQIQIDDLNRKLEEGKKKTSEPQS